MKQEIKVFTDHEIMLPLNNDGSDVVCTASGRVYYDVDPSYGADADGNRGQERRSISRVEVDKLEDDQGIEIEVTPDIGDAVVEQLDV